MRLRILHITARADHSGGPRHVYDLLSEMRNTADVFVACPDDRPFRDRYVKLLGPERVFTIPHRRFSLSALMELRSAIHRERIGILHSHGRGAGFYSRPLARMTGAPCVHTFHYLNVSNRLRVLEEKWLGRYTAAVVAVSATEAACVRRFAVVADGKVNLIANGVVAPEAVSSARGPVRQVVGVMRLEPDKCPDLFVRICGHLPDSIECRVLGSGTMSSELRRAGRVEFPGSVDEPRDYLIPGSIYLATSKGEGLSLAMLDAMAMGIPVVASAVPGHADLIGDGETGLLYPWGDLERAAAQVVRLIEDAGLRQRLAEAAWRSVRTSYRVERMVDELMKLYARIPAVK
jgi:glycosyltransferase involved in cell wall biosynthesis